MTALEAAVAALGERVTAFQATAARLETAFQATVARLEDGPAVHAQLRDDMNALVERMQALEARVAWEPRQEWREWGWRN